MDEASRGGPWRDGAVNGCVGSSPGAGESLFALRGITAAGTMLGETLPSSRALLSLTYWSSHCAVHVVPSLELLMRTLETWPFEVLTCPSSGWGWWLGGAAWLLPWGVPGHPSSLVNRLLKLGYLGLGSYLQTLFLALVLHLHPSSCLSPFLISHATSDPSFLCICRMWLPP